KIPPMMSRVTERMSVSNMEVLMLYSSMELKIFPIKSPPDTIKVKIQKRPLKMASNRRRRIK
ncbi:Uncharacterized protein FKW44_005007, partial [Caligus rogercresseyi]